MNRKLVVGLLVISAAIVGYGWLNTQSNSSVPLAGTTTERPQRTSVPSYEPEAPAKRAFDGDPCSGDCSGHEAGYRWAEEHSISDEDDCDTAGDTSNSPSFAEGCKAFVRGDADDSDDRDDDAD